ncbi:hypothetical protein E2C01_057357 [Portunus trituberculatus]|uniref:Uncharacterized protein n=1 Tax=Portunus trituberculatus TaxID=210409 RepID=A0A5B7GWK2_PORTR|nr:hypothetical protein [Portunus trituberculatus]
MVNVNPSFSYHALHSLLKVYGTVLCIRLVYDKDFPSNRCNETFLSCDEARLAYEHVASLSLAGSGFKTEFLQSLPEVRHIPRSRLFVAYYRNGRGNFIHSSRYLSKEIGTIPEGNLKKYGKGVLVRAKDITQARMLQHLPCTSDSMFETVKAHPTFNYSKGCVCSQDLYEFLEGEILAMCHSSVQKVTKMWNSSNMVLLSFFGSTLKDRIHIGLINLRVRSRQCLEQDILQLANSQFISLGSARRELLYRQKDGTVQHLMLHWPLALQLSLPVRRQLLLLPLALLGRPLKDLTKRHRGSAESLDLSQLKQSKVSTGAHNPESSRDRSAMVAPVVFVQPLVTPSVSDWASYDQDGLSMETSDDIVTAVPRGPTVSKSVVQPNPRPPMTGRSDDGSHHSPVGGKAAVQRPGTSQLPFSSLDYF